MNTELTSYLKEVAKRLREDFQCDGSVITTNHDKAIHGSCHQKELGQLAGMLLLMELMEPHPRLTLDVAKALQAFFNTQDPELSGAMGKLLVMLSDGIDVEKELDAFTCDCGCQDKPTDFEIDAGERPQYLN